MRGLQARAAAQAVREEQMRRAAARLGGRVPAGVRPDGDATPEDGAGYGRWWSGPAAAVDGRSGAADDGVLVAWVDGVATTPGGASPALDAGPATPSDGRLASEWFDWFGTGPGDPPDPVPAPVDVPPRPGAPGASRLGPRLDGVAARLRGYAADRMPVAVRGSARIPLAAGVAVLLIAVAVVGGALLRASTGGARVVEVGHRTRASAAGAAPTVTFEHVAATAGAGGADELSPGFGAAVPGAAGATDAGGGAGSAGSSMRPGLTAPTVVVVDVVGKVRRPGLVRLPAGSRVADALAAAGGPTDRAAVRRVNLARLLVDGEQVVVPDEDDPLPPAPSAGAAGAGGAPGGAAGGAAGGSPGAPLDLNAATAADLDGLPGIGPVIAGRIVAWRTEHQRFSRVDELAEVAGIGPKMLERLRPMVRV